VEILDGVEGLVHISELAQHHVENPREIIQPGDPVRVKILEIDSERRRLSLSIKRVEGQVLPVRPIVPPDNGDTADLDNVPELGLSEDVFAGADEAVLPVEEPVDEPGAEMVEAEAEIVEPEGGAEIVEPEAEAEIVEPEAEAEIAEPEAEIVEPGAEADAVADAEAEAPPEA
jgi:small subunit ribosomal protein S1